MLFHSLTFGIFFSTFLVCYVLARRFGIHRYVFLVFSNFFYGWWDWRFLGLVWITILTDFHVAKLVGSLQGVRRRRAALAVSLVVNLSILGFFKYWNFFIDSLSRFGIDGGQSLHLANLVLPIGISFYTFQSMSYVIDVYRNKFEPITNLLDFACFVTWFPQLVAGPIERCRHLLPQIKAPSSITPPRIFSGVFWFACGFYQKGVGDVLALFSDPVFADLQGARPDQVVAAILGFGGQIYCDFCGYSLMAIGLSRIVGIDLIWNFRAPYLATSIRQFWRRWHISLSNWLKDYLYISLGGSRKGASNTVRNLMLTMTICGLWHGAGWNFIAWGFLHGLFLLLSRPLGKASALLISWSELLRPFIKLAGSFLTLVAVFYAWLYFRCPTIEMCLEANHKIAEWVLQPTLPAFSGYLLLALLPLLSIDVFFAWSSKNEDAANTRSSFSGFQITALGCASALFLGMGLVLFAGRPTEQFIYFQF